MVAVNDFISVKVQAVAMGQQIDNQLDYFCRVGSATLAEFADAFITEYRDNICAILHDSYDVLQYQFKVIEGMIWLGESDTPPTRTRPAMRYSSQLIRDGEAADAGQETGAPHPTSTAVGVQKVCSDPTPRPGQTFLVGGEKLIKGFNRFGPILETRTEVGEGNTLTAATVTDFTDAFAIDALKRIAPGGTTLLADLCVLSRYRNKVHRDFPTGVGNPTFIYALVDSVNVNQFVTTQTTRKRRSTGA